MYLLTILCSLEIYTFLILQSYACGSYSSEFWKIVHQEQLFFLFSFFFYWSIIKLNTLIYWYFIWVRLKLIKTFLKSNDDSNAFFVFQWNNQGVFALNINKTDKKYSSLYLVINFTSARSEPVILSQ